MEVEKPPAGALCSDHHRQVESFLRPTMRPEEGVERRIGVFRARPGIGVIPPRGLKDPERERHERLAGQARHVERHLRRHLTERDALAPVHAEPGFDIDAVRSLLRAPARNHDIFALGLR